MLAQAEIHRCLGARSWLVVAGRGRGWRLCL